MRCNVLTNKSQQRLTWHGRFNALGSMVWLLFICSSNEPVYYCILYKYSTESLIDCRWRSCSEKLKLDEIGLFWASSLPLRPMPVQVCLHVCLSPWWVCLRLGFCLCSFWLHKCRELHVGRRRCTWQLPFATRSTFRNVMFANPFGHLKFHSLKLYTWLEWL